MAKQNVDYGYDIQVLYLEMMLADAETFIRCQSIFDHTLFDRKLQNTAKFINDYVVNHTILPTYDIVNSATKQSFKHPGDLHEEHFDWLLIEFETFIRHKGLERAILQADDMLQNGEYGPVEELIKKAVQVGLTKNLGTDYFSDPKSRLLKIKDSNGQMSTGWDNLDKILYGGFNNKELEIFCGGSGAGKSLFLANLSVNYALSGKTVVYLTLELSEELVAMRIDSMVTGIATKTVFKNIEDVDMKVRLIGKKSGSLQIKYLPSGKTCNDIRSYLKEYEVKIGKKVDVLVIDYLDLLMPISKKISAENLFIKDKYVSEELRNLAAEKNCVVLSAAQLNRCIFVDSIVISNGQQKFIKDVEVGDYLESNEGPVKVLEKLPITKQHAFKIKTKSGKEIICSANHKFPVGDELKTLATGLQVGDKLRTVINTNSYSGEPNDNKQNEIGKV